MSEPNELERLRADLARLRSAADVMEKYNDDVGELMIGITKLKDRIAKLEKAEADPWEKEKECVDAVEKGANLSPQWQLRVARYVRHIESENAKQAERIAELEARQEVMRNALERIAKEPDCGCVPCRGICESKEALKIQAEEIREIALNAVHCALLPDNEKARPVPPLSPKTVIATACRLIAEMDPPTAAFLMQYHKAGDAGIYPLAGDET